MQAGLESNISRMRNYPNAPITRTIRSKATESTYVDRKVWEGDRCILKVA
jgi:hypothetical protein